MFHNFLQGVARNCELASSRQAGSFSVCGLLLRLRQLYKWHHDLPPWQEPEPEEVLSWIAERESHWESLENEPFQELPLNGSLLDPFAVDQINIHLAPEGLVYGAGYGGGMAPTFFLAALGEVRRLENLTILILEEELARDLAAHPALRQGNLIYARRQSLAYFLWDRLADPTFQNNRFLKAGWRHPEVSLPGLMRKPEEHQEVWQKLLDEELEAVIRHEIGEAMETILNDVFPSLAALFPQSPLDYWLRALKDALADFSDHGRLSYIIAAQRLSSLAFMLAFQPGFYPLLLPELEPAFWEVARSGNWKGLEEVRLKVLKRLQEVAREAARLFARHASESPERLKEIFTARFLAPLGW